MLCEYSGVDKKQQQSRRHWEDLEQVPASEITVGVMGLGVLGQALSAQLCALNYQVVGYRRSQQDVEGVEVFYGEDGLQPFLSRSMIISEARGKDLSTMRS